MKRYQKERSLSPMKLDLPPTFNMDSNRKEALKFAMREMTQYKQRK